MSAIGELKKAFLPTTVIFLLCLAVGLTLFFPVYPDEVDYKIYLERYFITGGFKQSLTPFCEREFLVAPGVWLIPAASFWSLISTFGEGHLSYRLLPCFSLVALFAALASINLHRQNYKFWPLLLLPTLGPALYGIILLRPEIFVLLFSVVLYMLGELMMKSVKVIPLCLKTLVLLLLFSFCVYLHPKAFYLLAIPCGAILLSARNLYVRSHQMAYAGIFLGMAFAITVDAYSLISTQFMQCHSLPAIEAVAKAYMVRQSANPIDLLVDPHRFLIDLRMALGPESLGRLVDGLSYKTGYNAGFLPYKDALSFWDELANILIQAIVCCFILYIIVKIIDCMVGLKDREERKRLYLVCCVILSLAPPIVFNISRFYHDVAFMLGALMVSAGLLTPIRVRPCNHYEMYGTRIMAMGMIAVSMLCLCISGTGFTPQLIHGYQGISIPYTTDKQLLGRAIRRALSQVSIPEDAPLIVDDLTYDAVRHHSLVMPVTEMWPMLSEPGAVQHYSFHYHAHYGVVRCLNLDAEFKNLVPYRILATIPYVPDPDENPPEKRAVCLFELM